MAINQDEPPQAYETLTKNQGAIYLDVRTEGEFAQGHPEGAINIPVVFIKGPGQMEVNPDFVAVAEKVLPKATKLVVGCMAGGRSQRPRGSGRVVVPGGREAGLPVTTELGEVSYQAQRQKAGL